MWDDKVYAGYAVQKNLKKVQQLDLGDVYKWRTFIHTVNSGFRRYQSKIEYLVQRGEVKSVMVTCLQQPMADFDITSVLSDDELKQVRLEAERHYRANR